jgi:hypothetical protein
VDKTEAFASGSSDEQSVMGALDGERFLVRIPFGESDRFHHTPVPGALLER